MTFVSPFVHRYWTGTRRQPSISGFAKRCAERNGSLHDWTDATLPVDIREHLDELTPLAPPFARNTHRANVVRLLLLQKFGGVWLDHDAIIIDMPDRSSAWSAWAGGRVASSIMYFPSGHPLLQIAIDGIRSDKSAVRASGEIMLTREWADQDMTYHPLPFDASGRRDDNALPWAVHVWNSLEG